MAVQTVHNGETTLISTTISALLFREVKASGGIAAGPKVTRNDSMTGYATSSCICRGFRYRTFGFLMSLSFLEFQAHIPRLCLSHKA